MSRIVIHDHLPDGERFAPDAFANQVGGTIRLILMDGEVTHAQVVAADVVECGGVNITLEVAPWN